MPREPDYINVPDGPIDPPDPCGPCDVCEETTSEAVCEDCHPHVAAIADVIENHTVCDDGQAWDAAVKALAYARKEVL